MTRPTSNDTIRHVFVYGTLRPGDVRWHRLAPFVVDEGWADSVRGTLFDTGLDYPAAVFDPDGGVVHGQSVVLLGSSLDRALHVLDEVEGVVGGMYERVTVRTAQGYTAWAYAYGEGLELTPIPSGDWLTHRPLHRALPLDPPSA